MVHTNPPPPQENFIQLIGKAGSGCRRLAFDFIKPARRILWMSPYWQIYAPLLWQMGAASQIDVFGMECLQRRRLRFLIQEVAHAQVFDGLVLESFCLNSGEGYFIQRILRLIQNSLRIVVIDEMPHSFCSRRAHISLSHQDFRIHWSKGGDPTPRYRPFDYLQTLHTRTSSPCLS